MEPFSAEHLPTIYRNLQRRCLACGDRLPPRKRRYCDPDCLQRLHLSLNRRTGLLRALNTRYATFYFTDHIVVLDLLPYGTEQIFTFMLHRRSGEKPTADFCKLSNMLGAAWWEERDRTRKRYMASRVVLEKALRPDMPMGTMVPVRTRIPRVEGGSLTTLNLDRFELDPQRLQAQIKAAYRRQAKNHHPDLGGDSISFRKIREAYEKLIEWAQHPNFIRQNGFPDKWFYDGSLARWVQPTP
ncbi:MAG: J domain-containing protein [Desulfobacterales bacterium]|nr:J domain-containing protein [Desulfobacterales bacterium]